MLIDHSKSRIILALDFITSKIEEQMGEIIKHVAAIKIGLPLIIRNKHIIKKISEYGKPIIADLKLADIPATMKRIVQEVDPVDYVIAQPFVGESAIKELKKFLEERDIGLILVVAMSHPGAEEIFNKHFDEFLNIAEKYAEGVVAPATFAGYIKEARRKLGQDKMIISPGVGVQGAEIGIALKAGADFEIIGRYITLSEDPVKRILEINNIHKGIFVRHST